MNVVKIGKIEIAANRQRRDFDPAKLNELKESIEQKGLFHPVVVREDSGKLILVAGERRFRAISDLYDLGGRFTHDGVLVEEGKIPYVTLGELSELEREEAEYEENAIRNDLSWQESATATSRLAQLRQKQAVAASAPLPTPSDIAEEVRGSGVGRAREAVRRELIVAKNLHRPEVKAAKTMDEAFKLLKRLESTERDKELAATVGLTFTSDAHKLFNADATDWLLTCLNGVYDVIITDPPYGMGADEFGDSGGIAAGSHAYRDDIETFNRTNSVLAAESFRITKEQAHAYIFCDIDNFHQLKKWMEAAGWKVHRTPIIWHKTTGNRVPWITSGPQRKWEMILYAVKGNRPVDKIAPDVISIPGEPNLGHSAQKPVALYLELLKRSAKPGNLVLDPFGGTGPILEAAHELKVSATYVEIDPSSYGIALKRMERIKAQLELEM